MDFTAVLFVLAWIVCISGLLVTLVFSIRLYNHSKRKKREAEAKAPQPEPTRDMFVAEPPSNDPHKIVLGNFVRIGDISHAVRGKLEFNEDGFFWKEFWLESQGNKLWISVETEDGKTTVVQWTEVPIDDLEPGDKFITYNGTKYKLDEHGKATYHSAGTVDLPESGKVEYYDYESVDGDFLLSFERFDKGEWEVAEGFELLEGMYEVEAGITRLRQ